MQKLLDITPNPRNLRTLGDIPFAPWQCIAELVDNALDAFKSSACEHSSSADKRIIVLLSSDNVAAADRQLEVADTGPGIDLSIIQDSVRAGYTSNNTHVVHPADPRIRGQRGAETVRRHLCYENYSTGNVGRLSGGC